MTYNAEQVRELIDREGVKYIRLVLHRHSRSIERYVSDQIGI